MDLEDSKRLLKKLSVGELTAALQREVVEFATQMGYETTITPSTKLNFLYEIYVSERAKEKRAQEELKKAENLIMKLASLQQAIQKREEDRRRSERRGRANLKLVEGGFRASKKTRELLASIGITDEIVMAQAEELLGEEEIGKRVDLVAMIDVEKEVMDRLFGSHPETILEPSETDFMVELEQIETKKGVIDNWSEANRTSPPIWADYRQTPGILLDDYHDISRLLNIEEPQENEKKEETGAKYRSKPMYPADFMKVVAGLGFKAVRESKHGTLMRKGDDIMCVSRSHRAQFELNGSTIKKKLQESKVDLDEFEQKRRELKL